MCTDAKLYRRIGIRGFNCIGESFEVIHAGNEDVLHPRVLEFGDHLQPELGTFGLGDPQAQNLLLPAHIDAQRKIDRLGTFHDRVISPRCTLLCAPPKAVALPSDATCAPDPC
jgi:hypothetical protein